METVQNKQQSQEVTGIDKLLARLNHIQEKKKRISRDEVGSIFRQILAEIPYAFWVLRTNLSDNLLTDSPHNLANCTLNDVIVALGKAIFNASQRDELAQLTKTYIANRKITEKEYAATILVKVLNDADLSPFPEPVHARLREFGQSIIERIINEKQSRKLPDYIPRNIIELVEPLIYGKIYIPEIEALKYSHNLAFRKFVNTIAQDAYDQIHDFKILEKIQTEKAEAYEVFRSTIMSKAPAPAALETYTNILRLLQQDTIKKNELMNTKLDEFLKPSNPKTEMSSLSLHLRMRCNEILRKTLHNTQQTIAIYASEETLQSAQNKACSPLFYDIDAIKNLFQTVTDISVNFKKNMLHVFAGGKSLNAIESALVTVLIGSRDTKQSGYPYRTVLEIYSEMSTQLKNISETTSGVFSDKLKNEIAQAVSSINRAREELKTPPRPVLERRPLEPEPVAKLAAAPVETPEPVIEKPASPQPIKLESVEVKPVIEPIFEEPEKVEPVAFEPVIENPEEIEPISLEPIVQETEVIEPIAFEPISLEPVVENTEKIEPISLEPVVNNTEEIEPISLEPITLEPTEETPEKIEPITFENIFDQLDEPEQPAITTETVKPLDLGLQFDDEPLPEVNLEPIIDDAALEQVNKGLNIMKSYQLGNLENNVAAAWEKMVTASIDQSGSHESGLALPSDNEVRLYVICDLVQQVSLVEEEALPPEKKESLLKIKSQLIDAMKNPLDDNNWDVFEGMQRDMIDRIIAGL